MKYKKNHIYGLLRSKTATKVQLLLLVELMEAQPVVARRLFKSNGQELNQFWEMVSNELNTAKPPQKNIVEQKKVKFIFQKKAIF